MKGTPNGAWNSVAWMRKIYQQGPREARRETLGFKILSEFRLGLKKNAWTARGKARTAGWQTQDPFATFAPAAWHLHLGHFPRTGLLCGPSTAPGDGPGLSLEDTTMQATARLRGPFQVTAVRLQSGGSLGTSARGRGLSRRRT